MNSRERVLAALDHKEPDRVPIDLGGTNVTSLEVEAYVNLREFLGMKVDPEPEITHIQQGTVYPREDFLQHFGVDFRTITMEKAPRWVAVSKEPDGSWVDEYGIPWRPSIHSYYDSIGHPLAEISLSELDQVSWPDPYDPKRVAGLGEKARDLCEKTDYAVVADIICRGPFEQACKLRGYDQFCLDLAIDGEFAYALLSKITDYILSLWDAYLGAVGDYVHVACQGDDVGTQQGLFISPKMYRQFLKPCHKKIFDFIHAKTDAKVFYHCCGSIFDIVPDLIEIGVDVLNPVQYMALNMDRSRLKQEFGKDLCFWGGGIDTQQVLPEASPAEIESEVRNTLDLMTAEGGYVFAATHNIQPDVSPDRVDAVYRHALNMA